MDSANPKQAGVSRRGLATMGVAVAAATVLPGASAAAPTKALRVEDRLAIQDLFTDYLWAYDCTDEAAFIELFTADATVMGKATRYQGRDAILGWFRYLIEMREREGDDIWMHEAGQFRYVRSGKAWIVYAYATHFNGNGSKGTKGVRSLGYFTCECTHDGQGWKFHRFSISPWDRKQLPWKKPLPWAEG